MSSLPPVSIQVLRCGSMTVSRDTACVDKRNFYLPSARALTPLRERIELPVYAFLIRHPKGNILVDAGWDRAVSPDGVYDARAAAAALTPSLSAYYRPFLPAGEALSEQLPILGLRTSDINTIFLTHFDPDHISGLAGLGEIGHIVCSQEEYWWSCRTVWRLRQPEKLLPLERFEPFWFKGSSYGASFWSLDWFGDGSLMLVHLPGHTEGMFGLVVSRGERFAVIAADAVYDSSMSVPGFGFNPTAQRRSIDWLNAKLCNPNCVALLSSHNPSLSPGIIEL